MASWFYLELYTDTTQYVTEYLKSRILTETKRKCDMSKRLAELKDIYIDEATSHCICVTAENEDGSAMDLTDFSAVFTAGTIEKQCTISGSDISVSLKPEETTGYLSTGYQIRIFDSSGCVIQVIQGYIYIRKAHKPYTQNPLDTGGER